jgi:hypothetical protein
MSINKLVSIENPILEAMDQLQLEGQVNNKPLFTSWATTAEKKINSYFQYCRKRTVVDIVGCTACLPPDARYVQLAILGDLGEGCDDLYSRTCSLIPMESATINASTSVSSLLVVDMGVGFTEFLGSIPHTVMNNQIILNRNLDGKKLTIQYLGYKTDPNGFMMVGENHIQAIMWFIIWRYYFRLKRKSPFDYGQMNKAEQEWHRECANARALDNEISDTDREEINRMLNDPFLGRGLEVTMSTTLGPNWW